MIHHNLVDKPVSDTLYQTVNRDYNPTLFLGCRVRHKYDEERIVANNELKIKNLRLGNTFLKALQLPFKKESNLDLLYNQLCIVDDNKLSDQIYEKILGEFKLSSSECFAYRATGVYPINSECYDQVVAPTNENSLKYYYENFYDFSRVDCKWQNFSYLALFLLIDKS